MNSILTIDTEDWPQLMCSYLGREVPVSGQFASSTRRTLNLLERFAAKATFFVVAPHAEREPEVVREIAQRGHEVASHGWAHAKLANFTAESFAEDIRRSNDVLEGICGQRVRGYRAPFFSLLPEQTWAFEVMADCGLDYDSSLTTLLWQHEGIDLPDAPFLCVLPDGREILEIPALARKVGPITGRLIGGRTLRVLPPRIWRAHMREREASDLPAMVYVHSYEVTPDRLMRYVPEGPGLAERLKLTLSAKAFELGMGRMENSLKELLETHQWTTMAGAADDLRERGNLPVVNLTAQGDVEVPAARADGDLKGEISE